MKRMLGDLVGLREVLALVTRVAEALVFQSNIIFADNAIPSQQTKRMAVLPV